ncbi:hypothetical protein O9A_00643 [Bartonella koehlerae C-29]|uniref:Uncharacterized protein n=1 Tax=Bartonella koehlerae C-29 TaxID=1134510 RepID=A0A067WEW6_9HYPH|nr:hypothetical protein O9A_00643 [Bartonella koehlerae C-29]
MVIEHIGASDYGISNTPYDPISVLFTLPGEVAIVSLLGKYGKLIALEEQSSERVDAIYQHFENCGGYVLQH